MVTDIVSDYLLKVGESSHMFIVTVWIVGQMGWCGLSCTS